MADIKFLLLDCWVFLSQKVGDLKGCLYFSVSFQTWIFQKPSDAMICATTMYRTVLGYTPVLDSDITRQDTRTSYFALHHD